MVAQILAVIIFLAMFVLIVLEVWERHIITLGCGLLTLVLVFGLGMHSMSAVLETLNLGSFFTSHFVHGGTVRRGFQWYQLGDHRVRSRNDDHGRGNGPGGILPLAVHAALPRWSSIRLYRCLSPLWYYPVFWQCSLTVLP